MEIKDLRPNEQEKYSTAKEVIELGSTDTAIRRGKTKLGCTRKTLLKYIQWYKSDDISLFSHHNKARLCASIEDAQESLRRPLPFPSLRLSA